ncbi:T9SS type A sorting domain-containing protein [Allomuricauda sp. XS_ASV26]|uniref:T9SS type A sorting domain-containing protein n=1 Tax=Allomuricauda sp. XS_ASV26 TaxID=3241292 RepID=UPI0035153911
MNRNSIMALLAIVLCMSLQAQEADNDSILKSVEDYIYLGDFDRKESKRVFKQIEKLSQAGDAAATCLLGILYKDGIGAPLSFDKAREQFRAAHEMGNVKASYSLGYLYLKGLGNIPQDYGKALEWFTKSNHPMAKHWLAKMYYFGYGVPKDRARALDILTNNPIYNSEVLLGQLEKMDVIEDLTAQDEIQNGDLFEAMADGQGEILSIAPTEMGTIPESITGNWKGQWMEMDWSGTQMTRTFPANLTVGEVSDVYGTVESTIQVGESSTTSEAIWRNGDLTIFDGQVTIEKQFTDHPDYTTLDYGLNSMSFTVRNLEGTDYLLGRLESQILNWSEPGPPIMLVLTREGTPISKEALAAFAEQGDSFIKLYPNPFIDDLLIHYELETDAHVQVGLMDYYGGSNVENVTNGFLRAGEHVHTISNGSLKSGIYVVQVQVNDRLYTKLVVKR